MQLDKTGNRLTLADSTRCTQKTSRLDGGIAVTGLDGGGETEPFDNEETHKTQHTRHCVDIFQFSVDPSHATHVPP